MKTFIFLSISLQGQGAIYTIMMFLLCFAVVHIVKLAYRGYSLSQRPKKEIPPSTSNTVEEKKSIPKPTFFIVEKKKAPRKTTYSEPKEFVFK